MPAGSAAGALAAIALFLGPGLGLTVCLPGFAKTGLARRLAFAYLLGVAWIGLFLYAASHFGGMPIGAPLVFLAAFIPLSAGAAVAVGLLVTRKWLAPPAARPRRPLQALGWIGLSLLAALVSFSVLANALTHPLDDWDGRMTWSAQAIFIREAGSVDAEILRSPKTFVSHPRYPLLMPLAQVAVLEATGSDDERAFRAVYAAFFPALVLLVVDAGRRWSGRRAALLTTFALLTIPWIPFDREGGAAGAYSDLPLACFFGGGLLLLIRGRPRVSHGVAAGLLLAAAVLTKNEGLPEAAITLVLAGGSGLTALRRRVRSVRARLLATAAASGLVLAAFVLLFSWRSAVPNRYDESYFETFSVLSFVSNLASGRSFSTLPMIAARMFSTGMWGLFWWSAPLVFLTAAPTLRRPPTTFLAIAAATPVVVAWSAYSQVSAAIYYAGVTWNRILLQAAVPGFALLALAVRRLLSAVRSRHKA
ncbi:MAG TPA: hypothetical protein VGX68_24550 [Thermoanaerobaculia bacterium]|jgi:hypothetical protein|nr:hypothetical protein [Thermoanaerobaculia bacterium]